MKTPLIKLMAGVCLTVTSTIGHASWPTFLPPDKELMLALHLIETKSCPPGKGRLLDQAHINIHDHLCRARFCPHSWEWITNSNNTCQALDNFALQNIEIIHHKGNDNIVNYSEINAFYGSDTDTKTTTFKIIFKTMPDEHWYCVRLNEKTHAITCANDI